MLNFEYTVPENVKKWKPGYQKYDILKTSLPKIWRFEDIVNENWKLSVCNVKFSTLIWKINFLKIISKKAKFSFLNNTAFARIPKI